MASSLHLLVITRSCVFVQYPHAYTAGTVLAGFSHAKLGDFVERITLVIPIEAERVTCFHVVPAREGAAFNVTVGYRSGVVETFDLVLLAEATARRFATGPSLDLRPVLKGRRMHQATVVFSYRSFLFIGYEGLGLYWVAILRPSKYPKPRELVFTADSIGKVPTDIGDARLWETASSHGGGLVVIAITSDWSPDKFTNNGRLSL
ncbi:hypothetical protein FOZ62_029507 [Perkinsus olseni]|uniref:Uncharacterized protein n=1 Tax=Perkinsus olseni TaxID=32597 RepID=A0A7J6QUA6_PEROL|nr:hypothetical protein FOZ62_029507 [Perkinsus olseni]